MQLQHMYPFIHAYMCVCMYACHKHLPSPYYEPGSSTEAGGTLGNQTQSLPLRNSQSARTFWAINTTHNGVYPRDSRNSAWGRKVSEVTKERSGRKFGEVIRDRVLHAMSRVLYVILKGMESHSMFRYQEDYIPRLTFKIKIKRHCGQRIRKNFRLEVRRW